MQSQEKNCAPPLAKSLFELWAAYNPPQADAEAAPHAPRIYDVLIVGSGYGASTAASKFAACTAGSAPPRPVRVCLLERGREIRPGQFPDRLGEVPGHVRVARQAKGVIAGNHEGLFNFHLGDDVNVLVANGLGGGSLINAGVLLEPDPQQARLRVWRRVLTALQRCGYFAKAQGVLGGYIPNGAASRHNTIRAHPAANGLEKTHALKDLANPLNAQAGKLARPFSTRFFYPPISVAMRQRVNSANVQLQACTLCGDCMTGCNVGAKESLDTNLLRKAVHAGAEIYTGATVISVARASVGDGEEPLWQVNVVHSNPRLQAREAGPLAVYARKVVLAAGSLGSTEILLRSRTDKLAFSPALGTRFSCNGDNIASIRGLRQPAVASANEHSSTRTPSRMVGPTITGSIYVQPETGDQRPFLVQEFAVPAAIKRIYEETVATGYALAQLPREDPNDHGHEGANALDPAAVDTSEIDKSLMLGVIGHDDAAGSLCLEPSPVQEPGQPGTVRILWRDARNGAALNRAQDILERFAADYAATYQTRASIVANPLWRFLPAEMADLVSTARGPVLTVHPLGGCPLGTNYTDGVVNKFGQVFDMFAANQSTPADQTRDDWQGSLVVLDGSIIPESLGVNPALTICALAMRASDKLISAWEYLPPQGVNQPQRVTWPSAGRPALPPSRQTEIEIGERLAGNVTLRFGQATPVDCVVELTLAYAPTAIRELMARLQRGLNLDPRLSRPSKLRVFDAQDWHANRLGFASERELDEMAILTAHLNSPPAPARSLRLLHRERTTACQRIRRAFPAWFRNRGARDIVQKLKSADAKQWWLAYEWIQAPCNLWRYFKKVRALATRAGEVRRFDYTLVIGNVHCGANLRTNVETLKRVFAVGLYITGHKQLTYSKRANPWQQLTTMTLDSFPGLDKNKSAQLCLDARFLAENDLPLFRVVEQENAVDALADISSFALYLARLLASIHLWTFRKPDEPRHPQVAPRRLPEILPGIAPPEIHELIVDYVQPANTPVSIRLTRYRPASHSAEAPIVMIHGYSASGTTFAHPTLKPSAAAYFTSKGRDVWVLDLRTSAGLPSATAPWSMEQAALIDIPAALLHVRKVTGHRADVLAHCIGAAMLSMALLSDARSIRTSRIQLGVDTFLDDRLLGVLAAFNGSRTPQTEHPCVRRVILSQKGPLLQYTDRNIFQAHLFQYLRRWVLPQQYTFEGSQDPSVAEALLDRLLASLPYPAREYDRENPGWPCAEAPWVASRHRMDFLYGRTFEAANLSTKTLERINDFFGPLNTDTLSQAIHFSRSGVITNQRGRGEFVTRQRLRDCWQNIPTMILHGQRNGLVDQHTKELNVALLRQCGVPVMEGVLDDSFGHQDCLIGTRSIEVFKQIEQFLALKSTQHLASNPAASIAPLMGPPRPNPNVVFEQPWVGPVLTRLRRRTRTGVACKSRPDQGVAQLCLIPVRRKFSVATLSHRFVLVRNRPDLVLRVGTGDSRRWLYGEVDPNITGIFNSNFSEFGWLALLLYTASETNGRIPGTNAPVVGGAQFLNLAQRWISNNSHTKNVEEVFIRWQDVKRFERSRTQTKRADTICFTLASCQYPAGLLDKIPAQVSLENLADKADEIDLALFVGDQIYADASAGFADPTRRDEYFDQAHSKALRVEPMSRILRRVGSLALLDDHELCDNWEPLSEGASHTWPSLFEQRKRTARNGLIAFLHHQRRNDRAVRSVALPGAEARSAPLHLNKDRRRIYDGDETVTVNGFPFYLLDTRTGRTPRGVRDQRHAEIVSDRQRQRIAAWLLRNKHEPKFVATPSLLLPRRARTRQDGSAAFESDAWDGYPASMRWLFEFLVENQIQKTIFLSGDEHHSMCSEIELASKDPSLAPVRAISVHSSALYAPLPFANGKPLELARRERYFEGTLVVNVKTKLAPPGDGFAMLNLQRVAAGWHLGVHFVRPRGHARMWSTHL